MLNHDEISTFVESRYISASEAFWRLSEYEMQEKSHTIVRLPVHLPKQQELYYAEGEEDRALAAELDCETMLTAWFNLNATDADAGSHLYLDIPLHYRFIKSSNAWQKRKQVRGSQTIGRMYAVSPKDLERYFLRLLLLHTPGAVSFDDLRTVDNVTAQTYQEAAVRRGLVESNDQ